MKLWEALGAMSSESWGPATLIHEFRRFNDNFERYLRHLNVPDAGLESLPPERILVGEPDDELKQAVREHAIYLGLEPEDE